MTKWTLKKTSQFLCWNPLEKQANIDICICNSLTTKLQLSSIFMTLTQGSPVYIRTSFSHLEGMLKD